MPDARVSILIDAQDRANGVLERLRANLGGVSGRGGITGAAIGASKALSGIGFAVFGIQQIGSAISGLASGFFGFNSSLEQATITYGQLLGSAEAAQDRIAELQKFAALTPFNFDQVLEADRLLETFGARSIDTLTLVGDAAAGTSQNFNEVAFWIGRAYSAIQAGRPFGEAAMRLQEMGILTADGRTQLEALSEAGASSEEVWGVLNDEMGRFGGLMDDQSRSAKGLTSTLQDLGTMGSAVLTKPLFERYKRGVAALVNFLSTPRVQGGLAAGAEALEKALVRAEAQARRIFGWFRNQGIPMLTDAFRAFTASVSFRAFLEGFKGFFDAIRRAIPDLSGIGRLLDPLLQLLAKFGNDPRVANAARVIGAAAAAIIGLRLALLGVGLLTGTMTSVSSFLLTVSGLGPALKVLSILNWSAIGGGLGTLLQAVLPFAKNPYVLVAVAIIAAIGLALAYFDIDWDDIVEGFGKFKDAVADFAETLAGHDFMADVEKVVGALSELAKGIVSTLAEKVTSLNPSELIAGLGQVIYDAIYGLANLPAFIVERLSILAQNLMVKLADRIASIPVGDIKDAFATAIGKVFEALAAAPGLFAKAAAALGSLLLTLITNFPGAAGKVASGLGAALSALAEAAPGFLAQAAKDVGNTILNFLTAPLGNFADPARQHIKQGLMALLDAASVIYGVAKTLGSKILGAIVDGFVLYTTLPFRLATFLWNQISQLLGKAGALVVAAAGAVGFKIGDWIADGLAASGSFLGRLIEIIKQKLKDAWDAVPKPWDLFDIGRTAGGSNGTVGKAGSGMPIVVQMVFGGPTLATEAEMTRAARLLVPALRRELDRVYA